MNVPERKELPRLYYLNTLFDLSLGGYNTKKLAKTAAEMSCLFMALGTSRDKIILDVTVSDEYIKYLKSSGIDCPQVLSDNERCDGFIADPWGWDEKVTERFTKAGAGCSNPDTAVVKKVNSHNFSYLFNKKTGTGVPGAQCCASKDELIETLKSWKQFPLVIKPEFGNVGYGFIHKKDPVLSYRELKKVAVLFKAGKHVIVEPWLNRLTDISSRCLIDREGTITGIRHHQGLSNSVGKFYADLIDPKDKLIAKWRKILDNAVLTCAKELFRAGYFGPVGFDSITWQDESGGENLATIIEINARHPVSSMAYAVHDKLASDRVTMFIFVSNKKLTLPENYKTLLKKLGDYAFSGSKKRGAILVTPLRACYKNLRWIQPEKSVFFLAEETVEKVQELENSLYKILSDK